MKILQTEWVLTTKTFSNHKTIKTIVMFKHPKSEIKAPMKRLEKQFKESSEKDLTVFEKNVLEGRTFNKIQKDLKFYPKSPSLPPTMKSGTLESNKDCGKAWLLNDYFISVFGRCETPIPTGRRGKLTKVKEIKTIK